MQFEFIPLLKLRPTEYILPKPNLEELDTAFWFLASI